MSGKPSAIGFGFQPFGQFPFGHADWAEEVLYVVTPQKQKDDDALCPFEPAQPYRKWIDALKPQFQDLLDKWELFPSLWDANKVPIEQLDPLGYNFDVFPSTQKSEALRRSEVLNAIRFFLNKGIDAGYEIAAAFSGLVVTITPLWADTCEGVATLQEAGPTEFFATFDVAPADAFATDSIFTDFYAKWPTRLTWDLPCRSAFLKLFFETSDDTEIEEYSAIAEDIITNVERVRPIHVRISQYRFDGPRATGGSWTIPVQAENASVGGSWTIPASGESRAVGGGWSLSVVGTPTP
jgi:hypothetical protein